MNILLICNAGLSTSLIAQDIVKECENRNDHSVVDATGVDSIGDILNVKEVDVILLAPQVKFLRNDVIKNIAKFGKQDIKLVDIPSSDFGRRNAKNIVDLIYKELGK